MSYVLRRLLMENLDDWDRLVDEYEQENKANPVPSENNSATLHDFNIQISNLHERVSYDFARARRNKDAIERLIDNVLKDLYNGANDVARRAAGIQHARSYPVTGIVYPHNTVDLFELEDRFKYYFHMLEATIKVIEDKRSAKITNNSLLKIQKEVAY